MNATTSWRIGLGLIVAFWAFIALADANYPKPFIDDMSYIGAAINLAKYNVYTNPYCEMLTAVGAGPGQLFVDYMPAHNYFLAEWLRVFGISAASFHFLFVLLAFLTSWLIFRLFPAARLSWAAAAIICYLVYAQLGGSGLRADAYGFCLYLLGCNAWQERTRAGFFIKNLGLALTVITFPNLGVLAMLTTVASLAHRKLFLKRSWNDLAVDVAGVATAYVLCFVLFLLCIQGQLAHFLTSTALNQKLSALGVIDRFQFFTPLGIAKWVIVQAAFLAVVLTLLVRWWNIPARRSDRFFLGFCLAAFAVLSFSSVNSASGAHVWAFACMLVILFFIVREQWKLRAWAAYVVLLPLFTFGHCHEAVQHVLAEAPPDRAKFERLRQEVEQMRPAKIYADVYAAREVYDYRLPENAFSFETNSTKGWGMADSAATLPKGSVSIVSVSHSFPTEDSPDAGRSGKPVRIFGVRLPGVAANPYDLEIIDNR